MIADDTDSSYTETSDDEQTSAGSPSGVLNAIVNAVTFRRTSPLKKMKKKSKPKRKRQPSSPTEFSTPTGPHPKVHKPAEEIIPEKPSVEATTSGHKPP